MSDFRPVIFAGLFALFGLSLVYFFGYIEFTGAIFCFMAVVLSTFVGMYLQVLERNNGEGGSRG
ncbi:MAG: hypothetical protein Q8J79_06730 [Erythrobacter sp.]|nr:hypothetical protein [Erythrobacter sp.]